MRNLEKYKGIIPAFYSCYDEEGNISPRGVQSLTRYFVEKGVKGVCVGGPFSECMYQSVADRKIILENVMLSARGRLTIIVHTACGNTTDSRELAAHAESLHADAIAAIPPFYFHLPEHAIADYWNEISAAAPDTDFLIYHIPELTGTSLTSGLFKEMLKNPRLTGVINASMPVRDIEIFRQLSSDSCMIFNGCDQQFISGRIMGAEGAIGVTCVVMPELFVQMDTCLKNGEIHKAREIQYAVNEIISRLCSAKGTIYGVIKAVLKVNEGLETGGVRKPLPALAGEDMAVVKEAAFMIRAAKTAFLT